MMMILMKMMRMKRNLKEIQRMNYHLQLQLEAVVLG